MTLDDQTQEILHRVAPPGQGAAWVRAAIIEKAARDEQRGELQQILERLERIERKLGLRA